MLVRRSPLAVPNALALVSVCLLFTLCCRQTTASTVMVSGTIRFGVGGVGTKYFNSSLDYFGYGDDFISPVAKIATTQTPFTNTSATQADYTAVGLAHTAVLTTTGEIYLTGNNENGQLGTSMTLSTGVWTQIVSGREDTDWSNKKFLDVAVASGRTAVITTDYELYVAGYGENVFGSWNNLMVALLGAPFTMFDVNDKYLEQSKQLHFSKVLYKTNSTTGSRVWMGSVQKVELYGDRYGLVVTTDNAVWACSAGNELGPPSLGIVGSATADYTCQGPVLDSIPSTQNVTQVVMAGYELHKFRCYVLSTSGEVYGAGYYSLNSGAKDFGWVSSDTSDVTTGWMKLEYGTHLPAGVTVAKIAAGAYHTIILTTEGKVYGLGFSNNADSTQPRGALGDLNDHHSWFQITSVNDGATTLSTVGDIATGPYLSMIRSSPDGAIYISGMPRCQSVGLNSDWWTYVPVVGSTSITGSDETSAMTGFQPATGDVKRSSTSHNPGNATLPMAAGLCVVLAAADCPAGYTWNSNTYSCEACPGGTMSATGRGSCETCAAGQKSQSTTASTSCSECSTGTYTSTTGMSACVVCPTGTYQDEAGQTSCKQCPRSSTTKFVSSTRKEDCGCGTSQFGSPLSEDGTGFDCTTCPEGTVCDGQSTLPVLQPGYWALASDPTDISVCMPDDACLAETVGDEGCSDGYTSEACSKCDNGYFRSKGQCLQCITTMDIPAAVTITILIVFLIFASVVFCGALYSTGMCMVLIETAMNMYAIKSTMTSTDESVASGMKAFFNGIISGAKGLYSFIKGFFGNGMTMTNIMRMATPAAKLIRFSQVMTVVLSVTVSWPAALIGMTSFYSITAVDFSVLVQPGCNGDKTLSTYQRSFEIKMLLPFLFGATFLFVLLSTSGVQALLLLAKIASNKKGIDVAKLRRGLVLTRDYSIKGLIGLISIFYLVIHTAIMDVFTCYERKSGHYALVSEPSIRCFSDDPVWIEVASFGVIGFVLFSVGFPVLFFTLMRWNYKNRENESVSRRFSKLWDGYNSDYYWWESVSMFLRFLFGMALPLRALGVETQLNFLVLLTIAIMVLHVRTYPVDPFRDNRTETVITLVTVYTALSGLMIYGGTTDTHPGFEVVFTGSLVMAHLFVWVWLISMMIIQVGELLDLKKLARFVFCGCGFCGPAGESRGDVELTKPEEDGEDSLDKDSREGSVSMESEAGSATPFCSAGNSEDIAHHVVVGNAAKMLSAGAPVVQMIEDSFIEKEVNSDPNYTPHRESMPDLFNTDETPGAIVRDEEDPPVSTEEAQLDNTLQTLSALLQK